jgi:hypothetical protein
VQSYTRTTFHSGTLWGVPLGLPLWVGLCAKQENQGQSADYSAFVFIVNPNVTPEAEMKFFTLLHSRPSCFALHSKIRSSEASILFE